MDTSVGQEDEPPNDGNSVAASNEAGELPQLPGTDRNFSNTQATRADGLTIQLNFAPLNRFPRNRTDIGTKLSAEGRGARGK